MNTCETCETCSWSTGDFVCDNADSLPTYGRLVTKDFGCIHHDKQQRTSSEVTIEDTIEWLKLHSKYRPKCVDLAIRALEEMKEREEDQDAIVKDFSKLLEQFDKSISSPTQTDRLTTVVLGLIDFLYAHEPHHPEANKKAALHELREKLKGGNQ
jgi:hypothetical protein